jgi:hypothetical protein
MIVMDKLPLITECRSDLNWYKPYRGRTWLIRRTPNPDVSRTTIIHEVPTKSNMGLCSQDEVLAPSDVRPGCHPGLPHSPSNKPPRSREGWFNKLVTGLWGLAGPIKPDTWSVQIKDCHRGQNNVVLNRHRQGLPSWNLRKAMSLSPPFPSEWSPFA